MLVAIIIFVVATLMGILVRILGGGFLPILILGGITGFLVLSLVAILMDATGFTVTWFAIAIWFVISLLIRFAIKKM